MSENTTIMGQPISPKKSKEIIGRYFNGDWDAMPKFMQKYRENSQEKKYIEDVMRYMSMTPRELKRYMRPPLITDEFRRHYNYLRENIPALNADPAGLQIEQLLAQDRHFHREYFNNNIAGQVLARVPGVTRVMEGNKSWEIKHHELTYEGTPNFTKTFKTLGEVNVGPAGKKHEGIGWGVQYTIDFATLDMARGGGFYDIDYWHIFFLGKVLGRFTDQRLWLGGAGEHTTGQGAPNLTGIHNDANVASVQLGLGDDDDMGNGMEDWNDMMKMVLSSFFGNKVFAPGCQTVIVMTSGLAEEFFHHDSTVGALKTMYQQFQDKWINSGQLDAIYISNNIEKDANAISTQRLMALRLGPNYIRRTLVYPLQRKVIIGDKKYSDDIAFAYLTGDILQIYDGNAICNGDSDLGSGHTGYTMNGLFMARGTPGQRVGFTNEV